ncbi:sugar transferase [Herbiconiux sp. A18JL235]|uniref:Sugar transferase n=1 Tax=Herbiconiux sp. A18JL235 TaxID=3152363 RepID=A0AB39BJI0_9MICO
MTVATHRVNATESRHDWRQDYSRRLSLSDFIVIVVAVVATQLIWFGPSADEVRFRTNLSFLAVSYTAVSVILAICWTAILGIIGSRSDRIVGTGTAEYRLVVDGSLRIFGLLAIIAFLFQIDFSRGYFIVALPLGTIALVVVRWGWRQWLNRHRAKGEYSAQVLLVGSEVSVLHTARELARHPQAGYNVVGACVPSGRVADYLPSTQIPVAGSVERVDRAIAATGADTIVITSSDELSPDKIRQLSWSLEPGRQHLVVAPSLTDIGGPRIHTRPVAGLPLIHVETPRYEGFKRYQKRIFDFLASGALIIIALPVLVLIALLIRLTSPGPVLFKQERVGLNGTKFSMLKFRSMVTNADALIEDLKTAERTEGNTVLFKMKDDPRVTRVGRVLRKFSLDELPQLFNVLRGDMSLIGPRPPLQREVELYETHVHRRFLMKPGITGLWQVSGRSDLSWEDSVRLDLYYVENWSIVGDFIILLKTVRAVFAGSGAY